MQEKEGRMSDFDVSETVGELENMVNAAWDAGYAKGVDWAKKFGGGIDAMTDSELAERGLVRMPVDADGVRWTGEEQYATFDGSEYNVECLRKDCHGWMVQMIDLDVKQFRAPTELCRHVPDEPADTPASLADELDALTVRGFEDDELHDLADRLRAIGGGE